MSGEISSGPWDNYTVPCDKDKHGFSAPRVGFMNSGEKLVTIEHDGTVIIHKHGADKAAAELLWGSVQDMGQLLNENRALKAELAMARARNEEMDRRYNQLINKSEALEALLSQHDF